MKIEMHKNDVSCSVEITVEEVIQLNESGVLTTLFNIAAAHSTAPSNSDADVNAAIINELYEALLKQIKPYIAELNDDERCEIINYAHQYCAANHLSAWEEEGLINKLQTLFAQIPYKPSEDNNGDNKNSGSC